MRDHSQHVEVSRQQATEMLLEAAAFSPTVETVSLADACGRVLASDAVAQLDMPNCLTCRMDSVAVHWSDFEQGMPDTTGWQRGVQWQFANTGVGMPEGFDTAIVIENVELAEDESAISFRDVPSAQFAGTSPAGSRMRAGDVLVRAGALLTPLLVSHIASGNNTHVQVVVRPKVAFVPTGNELVVAGGVVPRGKNIETNSYLVAGKVRSWGGTPVVLPIVPDDQELIKQAVREACAQADIVVLNAGSSKGSDDWNVEMLDEIGRVLYHQTNHGPGHHSSGAVVDGVVVVGISGPPGGAAFTTDFYVKPLIERFLGQNIEPTRVRVRLAEPFATHGKPAAAKANAVSAPASTAAVPDVAPVATAEAVPAAAPASKGEVRPSVARAGKPFFGVKQLWLQQGDDGVIEARPFPTSHPDAVQASSAHAYYLLENGSGAPTPAPGDFIEVELR